MQKALNEEQEEREELFKKILEAYSEKYSWLGAQACRQMLISVATWNLEQYSNPPFRYRTHVMLAWDRGFLKSTMMREMADLLGEEMVSIIGKVSDAAMRGSVSGGKFTPPKPLRTPIVISTEFGQTDFNDELLNLFLNLLEEGHTNIALNKIASLSENQKRNIENDHDNQIDFKANNEFDLRSNFVFWGASYDPTKLDDDALRSRFSVATPNKPLDHTITQAADSSPSVRSQLSGTLKRRLRKTVNSEKEYSTDFKPTPELYEKYNIIPRESRDIQSYMAARNWWGLKVNPEIMEEFIKHLKRSRRLSTMKPRDRVFDLIFDNPMSYSEIRERTGLDRQTIYKIVQQLEAERYSLSEEPKWVIWSGDDKKEDEGGLKNL